MNPFLEIPICITNIDKEEKVVTARIKPGEIEYYYPGFNWGTCLIMKSGNIICSTWTFEQTEAAITAYVAHMKKNPTQFGNLAINHKPDMVALKPEPV